MKRMFVAAWLVAIALVVGAASAQEKSRPAPLRTFLEKFMDIRATSAQKEVALPAGIWYEGTITVNDVDYYKQQGKDPAWIEIKDWNYPGGCYLLLFRSTDTAEPLKLRVGDQAVVRAKFSDFGVHQGKYVNNCETHFAVFKETQVLSIQKPTN